LDPEVGAPYLQDFTVGRAIPLDRELLEIITIKHILAFGASKIFQ
jgi:hypothetical protein|tara:strand:- start:490 stop:624 length:135 start_codon:yes stop_codon:yes gene_type:complete